MNNETEEVKTLLTPDAKSWQKAEEIIAPLLPIPPALKDVIRTLWRENHKESFSFHPGHIASLRLLEKSKAFLAILHQAAKDICPERLEANKHRGSQAQVLLSTLGKNSFTAILALSYIQGKALKQIQDTSFRGHMRQLMNRQLEIGHVLGSMFEDPGAGSGMLYSGVRAPVYAMIIQQLSKTTSPPSITEIMNRGSEYQLSTWGCSEAQASSLLIRALGFQCDLNHLYAAFQGDSETSLPQFYQSSRGLLNWVKHFETSLGPPAQKSPFLPLIPTASQYEFIKTYITTLKSTGSRFHWLEEPLTS